MACWVSNKGKRGAESLWSLCCTQIMPVLRGLNQRWFRSDRAFGTTELGSSILRGLFHHPGAAAASDPQPPAHGSTALQRYPLYRGVYSTGSLNFPIVFFRFFPFPLFSSSLFPFSPFPPLEKTLIFPNPLYVLYSVDYVPLETIFIMWCCSIY